MSGVIVEIREPSEQRLDSVFGDEWVGRLEKVGDTADLVHLHRGSRNVDRVREGSDEPIEAQSEVPAACAQVDRMNRGPKPQKVKAPRGRRDGGFERSQVGEYRESEAIEVLDRHTKRLLLSAGHKSGRGAQELTGRGIHFESPDLRFDLSREGEGRGEQRAQLLFCTYHRLIFLRSSQTSQGALSQRAVLTS